MARVRVVRRHPVGGIGARTARHSGARALHVHSHSGHLRRLIYVLGTGLCMAAIAHASYGFLLETPYFRLSRLEIEGVSTPMAQEIEEVVGGMLRGQRSLISLNTGELLYKLRSYPRLNNLRLEKLYPDTLLVRAAEREPVAIINANTKGFFLIDNEACVVEKLKPTDLRNYDFPYVTGIPTEQVQVGETIDNRYLDHALFLMRVLKERNTELCARLSEIHIENDPAATVDGLTARFSGGLDVRFGDKDPLEKMPALDLFITKLQEEKTDPFSMAYVDLRFDNQIVYMDRETAFASLTGDLEQFQQELEAATPPKTPGEGKQATSSAPEKEITSDEEKREETSPKKKTQARREEDSEAGAAPRQARREPGQRQRYQAYQPQQAPAQPQQPSREPQPQQQNSRFSLWQQRSQQPAAQEAPAQGGFFRGLFKRGN